MVYGVHQIGRNALLKDRMRAAFAVVRCRGITTPVVVIEDEVLALIPDIISQKAEVLHVLRDEESAWLI